MADANINVKIKGDSSSAEAAIDKVGSKLENALGEKMGGIAKKALKMMPMAGAAAGVALVAQEVAQLAGKVSDTADQMAQLKSRINLINDGTQTTTEIMDKVYAAAQRSRDGYVEMADSVAKLNMLAKDAFSSNDEAIAFVEQLNKQFKISGASVQESTAAMYQLTQAMAAGKLQGDEFRSIMENAPMLAQAIAQQMGMTVGQLKEMSSQGLITADVIKEALFNSAEETNAKFAEIPMTFAEIGQQLSNQALQTFQPVLEQLSSITASSDFQAIVEGIGISFKVMSAAAQVAIATLKASFSALITVIKYVASSMKAAFSVIIGIGNQIKPIIAGVAVAFTTWKTAILAVSVATKAAATAQALYKGQMVASRIATIGVTLASIQLKAAMIASAIATAGVKGVMMALSGTLNLAKVGTMALGAATKVMNAIMRANPVGIVITILSVLAGVLGTCAAATQGFGETASAVWETLVHTVAWAINQIIALINKLINAVNGVGAKLASVFDFDFSAINNIEGISPEEAQAFGDTIKSAAGDVFNALSGGGGGEIDGGGYDGGGGGGYDAGGAGGGGGSGGSGGGGGAGSAGNQLAEEAKRIHEQIQQNYLEMFGKQSELVELQYKKELEELNKSKDANEHYQEDLTNLQAIYAEKRIQAEHEEQQAIREVWNKVRDMAKDFNFSISTKDSTGSASPLTQLEKDHEEAINSITDKWQGFSDEYIKMTKQQQAEYKAALDANGIAYEIVGKNEITFEAEKNKELLAQEQEYLLKRNDLYRQMSEEKWAIDEALRTQNFASLQQALTDEYVMTQDNYNLRKEMLDEYQQAVMDSYFNTQEMWMGAMMSGIDALQEGLSGLLQGTTSLGKAFENIGKALIKSLADYVANWAAARLKQAILGKTLQQQETAASVAAANAQIPPWTTLAQQVAMATGGVSATTGMAAWTAQSAIGAAAGLAMQAKNTLMGSAPNLHMASGGVAVGRTYAEIGEGKYPEAVIPLSTQTYDEMGAGIARANGGAAGGITLNVSALDAESFGNWLESKGGRVLRQFTVNQDREFIGTSGVW